MSLHYLTRHNKELQFLPNVSEAVHQLSRLLLQSRQSLILQVYLQNPRLQRIKSSIIEHENAQHMENWDWWTSLGIERLIFHLQLLIVHRMEVSRIKLQLILERQLQIQFRKLQLQLPSSYPNWLQLRHAVPLLLLQLLHKKTSMVHNNHFIGNYTKMATLQVPYQNM